MATLESSILTNTIVASKNGERSTSTASGSVIVVPKVYLCPSNDCSGTSGALVDITTIGGTVTPNQVTFNQRTQTLSATLQGLNCTIDPTTGVPTCADPETIGLLLSTMSANGFNFLVQTPNTCRRAAEHPIDPRDLGREHPISTASSAIEKKNRSI